MVISSAIVASVSSLREARTSLAPNAEAVSAVARPMPLDAPVMTMTCSPIGLSATFMSSDDATWRPDLVPMIGGALVRENEKQPRRKQSRESEAGDDRPRVHEVRECAAAGSHRLCFGWIDQQCAKC